MELADRFVAEEGGPVELEGKLVHSIYRRQLREGMRVRVVRCSAAPAGPTAGLRLKLHRGRLRVGTETLADIVLWSDTSPEQVTIECEPAGGRAELRAWNCWRDEQGVMQAWLANAGMLVQEEGDVVILRCSSGPGGVSFGDLVVELRFEAE